MEIIIITSLILIAGLTLVLFVASYKREQKYRKVIEDQNNTLSEISDTVVKSNSKLKELDEKGVFESDDEVGHFFEEVKKIQSTINQFILKYEEKEK